MTILFHQTQEHFLLLALYSQTMEPLLIYFYCNILIYLIPTMLFWALIIILNYL